MDPGQGTYLDHAATTAIRPSAVEAYVDAARVLGNPSSQHAFGRRARGIFDDARADIAELLGVPASWILMTSGGTEADNLALRGVRGRVIGAVTDHPAIVDTVRDLGGDLAPVLQSGLVDLEALEEMLSREEAPALVSVAAVNNETGIIQDLGAVSALARAHGTVVHTDAVQAAAHLAPPDFDAVDLASFTGHKIGAPVGVGVLVANPAVNLAPFGTGGGQQREIRSGTLDAAHAAAFSAALRETVSEREKLAREISGLASTLINGILQLEPRAHITAAQSPHSDHVVHVCFDGADQDTILFLLDQHAIACSAGSACHAGVTQTSHVLEAMGLSGSAMRGAVRFSFGWTSTAGDVARLLEVLPEVLPKAYQMGALTRPS